MRAPAGVVVVLDWLCLVYCQFIGSQNHWKTNFFYLVQFFFFFFFKIKIEKEQERLLLNFKDFSSQFQSEKTSIRYFCVNVRIGTFFLFA